MILTKPAGVAFQVIGGVLLFTALTAAIFGSWALAILAFLLGGWMFFHGGKRARQKYPTESQSFSEPFYK
jgi:hypothetical protein